MSLKSESGLPALVQNLTEIVNIQQQALVAMNKRIDKIEAGATNEVNKQVESTKGDSKSRSQ